MVRVEIRVPESQEVIPAIIEASDKFEPNVGEISVIEVPGSFAPPTLLPASSITMNSASLTEGVPANGTLSAPANGWTITDVTTTQV